MASIVKVIRVEQSDISKLQKIARQTFSETFAGENTEENMTKYLLEGFSTEKLTAELADPNAAFYFAVVDQGVVGYLKLNFGESQTELKASKGLEIERIYVLSGFHGKKVGQALYEKALDVAMHLQSDFLWLGVWEQNPRAIQFYVKNGFVAFDTHVFKLGNDEQTDIMMRLDLGRPS